MNPTLEHVFQSWSRSAWSRSNGLATYTRTNTRTRAKQALERLKSANLKPYNHAPQ